MLDPSGQSVSLAGDKAAWQAATPPVRHQSNRPFRTASFRQGVKVTGLTVVTTNPKDFARFKALKVVDWGRLSDVSYESSVHCAS
jgi:hypothetical protein